MTANRLYDSLTASEALRAHPDDRDDVRQDCLVALYGSDVATRDEGAALCARIGRGYRWRRLRRVTTPHPWGRAPEAVPSKPRTPARQRTDARRLMIAAGVRLGLSQRTIALALGIGQPRVAAVVREMRKAEEAGRREAM